MLTMQDGENRESLAILVDITLRMTEADFATTYEAAATGIDLQATGC
jgi:hypothetical protein